VLLVLDEDYVIHVMKGERYGKVFVPHIKYESDYLEDEFKVIKLYTMMLISTSKVIAIIDKQINSSNTNRKSMVAANSTNEVAVTQIFEYDPTDTSSMIMARAFIIVDDKKDEAIDNLRGDVIIDDLNNCFYIKEYTKDAEDYGQSMLNNN
jgi:hypothetical protein